jgi:adenylylsulfate kinase
MGEPVKQNAVVIPPIGGISREDRERLSGHKAVCIWLTGLSGAGKSTVAHGLELALHQRGHRCYVCDGDKLRTGLCGDLGFSPEARTENVRRVGELARLFVDAGMIAIVAMISPYRADRDRIRSMFGEGCFLEVYCSCALNTCEQRDSKGLYKRARSGEIREFTGISAPYEEPLIPEFLLDLGQGTAQMAVDELVRGLEGRKIIL